MKKNSPGSENSFAKKAKPINIPSQFDNKDYGKKTKLVPRKVQVVSSGPDHKFYGSRAIMTKEHKLTFIDHLIQEAATDLSAIPDSVFNEIKSNIRKGAKDLEQQWRDALELVHKAYHVTNVRRPIPSQKGAWNQYEALIKYGVQQLRSTRGSEGAWRLSKVMIPESVEEDRPIGNRRYFVELPGHQPHEVEADNMDEIIDSLTNKLRRDGAKLRIESRDKYHAVASIWVGDVKRDEVIIKEI